MDFERARAAFVAGVQAFERGELDAAEAHFRASLEACPGRASALANLGAVLLRLNRPAEALEALDAVLAQEPASPDALLNRGLALADIGRVEQGVACLDRVLELVPDQAFTWGRRGAMLKELGRLDEAAASLRRAIELGDDPELNRFLLASLEPAAASARAPEAPPARYVETLFDGYAERFDEHLVGVLGYDTPARLVALLPPGRHHAAALDLGCGTGLAAPLLAPRCAALDGVDLSSGMLAQAARRGLYRDLVHAEVVAHLEATERRFDLVFAADVLVYLGALEALFAGIARVLVAGGLFAYSVEEAEGGAGWQLGASSRYRHGEAYLRRLGAASGLRLASLERAVLRREQSGGVAGLLVVMERA